MANGRLRPGAITLALLVGCSSAPAPQAETRRSAGGHAAPAGCAGDEVAAEELGGLCLPSALATQVEERGRDCTGGRAPSCTFLALLYEASAETVDAGARDSLWERACAAGDRSACVRRAELGSDGAEGVLEEACLEGRDLIACFLRRGVEGGERELRNACREVIEDVLEPEDECAGARCGLCDRLLEDPAHLASAEVFARAAASVLYPERQCFDGPQPCGQLTHLGVRALLGPMSGWSAMRRVAELEGACVGNRSTYSCEERADACPGPLEDVRCDLVDGDAGACVLHGFVLDALGQRGRARAAFELGCAEGNDEPYACALAEPLLAELHAAELARCLSSSEVRTCSVVARDGLSEEVREQVGDEVLEICRAECHGRRSEPACQCVCSLGEDYFVPELAEADRALSDSTGRVWGNRCYAHLQAGRLEAAWAACERGMAVASEPRVQGALLYNIGRINLARGEYEGAVRSFQDSLERRPGNEIVQRALDELRE